MKVQKQKEKIIVDVNAIMLENKKKRKGTSSIIVNKVITKVSLPQEGDIGETIGKTIEDISKPITNANKLVAISSVVNKAIEVATEKGHNLRDIDPEHILEVEVL